MAQLQLALNRPNFLEPRVMPGDSVRTRNYSNLIPRNYMNPAKYTPRHVLIKPEGVNRNEANEYCMDYCGLPTNDEASMWNLGSGYAWHTVPGGIYSDDPEIYSVYYLDEHDQFEIDIADDPGHFFTSYRSLPMAAACRC
jgi:hypothetical protein